MCILYSVHENTKKQRDFVIDLNNPFCISVYELTNNGHKFIKTFNTTSVEKVKNIINKKCSMWNN